AVTEGVWTYRTGPLVVAANFTDQLADLPAEAGEVLLTTSAEQAPPSPGVLSPWEGVITRRSGSAAGHDQLGGHPRHDQAGPDHVTRAGLVLCHTLCWTRAVSRSARARERTSPRRSCPS